MLRAPTKSRNATTVNAIVTVESGTLVFQRSPVKSIAQTGIGQVLR